MKAPKIVLDQIDKSVNPDRDLGKVKLNKPIILNYSDKEVVSQEGGVNVTWKKRYYSFDRGLFFPLDVYKFTNYFGKIYRTNVPGEYGNFIDFLDLAYSNVQYSTELYVTQDVTINMNLLVSNGSVTVYINNVVVFESSDDTYYIPAKQVLNLKKGWNTLDIFIYQQESNAIVQMTSDIGKRVNTWRQPDFTPPNSPDWASTNYLTTEYIDPIKSPALKNVLRWVNAKYNDPTSSLRGWGIYRRINEIIKDENGSNVNVVSGWGTGGFVVSGDRRSYFTINSLIYFDSEFTVSGTRFRSDIGQTQVDLLNFNYDQDFEFDKGGRIIKVIYKHITDVEYDPSLSLIVSGTDTGDIKQGSYYTYCLDAYDDSINKNRSEMSIVKTIKAGDFEKPNRVPEAEILDVDGGLKRLNVTINNPINWNPPQPDVVGFRIWTEPDPGVYVQKKDCLMADIPIAVSGSVTCFSITQTLNINTLVRGPLEDLNYYEFYVSCYDWFGNEYTSQLPMIAGETSVYIRTASGTSTVVYDGTTNALRVFKLK